jgi:hypothetical protein
MTNQELIEKLREKAQLRYLAYASSASLFEYKRLLELAASRLEELENASD